MNRSEFRRAYGRIVCDRCGRHVRDEQDLRLWNGTFDMGIIKGYLCPDCQTIEEDLEAQVNQTLNTNAVALRGPDGRWRYYDLD